MEKEEEIKEMANYITNLQEENKQLKDKLNLIEEYYEENNFIKRMKFYIKYYKEKCKNGNCTNNRKNDTSANYTICNDSTSNTWNNENSKIFNNKEIEERK